MIEINENKNKILERMRQNLTERQKIIIEEMKKNPQVTYWDLQLLLGINEKSVYNNIKKLKEKGIVRRIGPNYRGSGHWEVLK